MCIRFVYQVFKIESNFISKCNISTRELHCDLACLENTYRMSLSNISCTSTQHETTRMKAKELCSHFSALVSDTNSNETYMPSYSAELNLLKNSTMPKIRILSHKIIQYCWRISLQENWYLIRYRNIYIYIYNFVKSNNTQLEAIISSRRVNDENNIYSRINDIKFSAGIFNDRFSNPLMI